MLSKVIWVMICGSRINGSWVPDRVSGQLKLESSVSDSKASDRQSYKKPRGSKARPERSARSLDRIFQAASKASVTRNTLFPCEQTLPAWRHLRDHASHQVHCQAVHGHGPRPLPHALPHSDMSVTCHVGTVPRLYHKFTGDAERSTEPEEKEFYRVCHFDGEPAVHLDEHGSGKRADPAAT